MSYSLIATPKFKQALKRLVKKFSSLKKGYSAFLESLEKEPFQETPYLSSTKANRKRLDAAIEEMNKGKFLRHKLIEK